MKTPRVLPLLALLLALPLSARAGEKADPPPPRPVDLVLCLDTSGSMEGLIDAARQKLWGVVSELASAKPTPDLRVALLTYGSPGNDATGHVVLQSGLTRDLDGISERLFALGTEGGDEFVGRVTKHALDHLAWSSDPRALRVLFVAGNESADQDQAAPFRDQARRAAREGIVVNAIYCGGADDADASGYRELAALAKGRYASIDQNHGTVAVATPFDAELAELSEKLNTTYVAYGRDAPAALERQSAQDANAAGAGAPAAAERAEAKAGRLYRNATWDLVDRMGEEGFDLAKVPPEELPAEMRTMTLEERKAHLEKKKAERAGIQARIQELAKGREAYVATEMSKRHLDDSQAFDRALEDAIREQARAKGFTFE